MVHRALLGSIERFFGVYLEHTAGAFPIWLAPEQAAVIPVGPDFVEYAVQVSAELKKAGVRATAMLSDERMNAKIRDAQNQKVPYMLVVGAKERDEGTIAVRVRDGRQLPAMKAAEFVAMVGKLVADRSLVL
jgi:threonyl-tRNA synthetase